MKSYLTAFLLLALAVLPLEAKKTKLETAPMIPTVDPVLNAMTDVITDSKVREAQLKARVTALQRQIAAIKAKAKNAKIDLGDQLSKEDLDTFNLVNTQLRYLASAMKIEEVRQKDLMLARDLYRASFFVATAMSEYLGDKGVLDDDFDDFCRARAKTYGLEAPVGLLFNAQDYVIDNGTPVKK